MTQFATDDRILNYMLHIPKSVITSLCADYGWTPREAVFNLVRSAFQSNLCQQRINALIDTAERLGHGLGDVQ